MVWFQCEDCGENLKKPKLPAHFWKCSASKLSCIDCGQMFGQELYRNTQCITESASLPKGKYGPKGQAKPASGTTTKNSNQKSEVDINVGLSERPPWYCSLCKTNTTSRQALLLHADGKKHRGKARGFHAANQKSNHVEVLPGVQDNDSVKNSSKNLVQYSKDVNQKKTQSPTERTEVQEKKRKLEEADSIISMEKKARDASVETCNGEVIRATASKCDKNDNNTINNMKWKKLITASLKTGPKDGLKMRKLKKFVIKALGEVGAIENEDELNSILEHKISSSHKFEIVGKYVRLATKM